MPGNLLRFFERTLVAQIRRNPRRAKRVIANLHAQSCGQRPSPEHPLGIGLCHFPATQLILLLDRLKQPRLRLIL